MPGAFMIQGGRAGTTACHAEPVALLGLAARFRVPNLMPPVLDVPPIALTCGIDASLLAGLAQAKAREAPLPIRPPKPSRDRSRIPRQADGRMPQYTGDFRESP